MNRFKSILGEFGFLCGRPEVVTGSVPVHYLSLTKSEVTELRISLLVRTLHTGIWIY